MEIRQYQSSDWTRICQIHDCARPDELLGSCDPKAFVPLENDPEAQELKASQIWVAQMEARIVGFAALDGSYLGWLYVDPAHYRSGVGRALLQHAMKISDGELTTTVLSGNEAAIGLYTNAGFVEIARSPGTIQGYPCETLKLRWERE